MRICAAALGAVMMIGGTSSTLASFNDSATATMTADIGHVEMSLDGLDTVTKSIQIDIDDLQPGDHVRRPITASLNTTVPARFEVSVGHLEGELLDAVEARLGYERLVLGKPEMGWSLIVSNLNPGGSVPLGRYDQNLAVEIKVPTDIDPRFQGTSATITLNLSLTAR